MFESLKKKFSRTSDKLTDELKEEAEQENNIQSFQDQFTKKTEEKKLFAENLEEKESEEKEEVLDKKGESSFFSFGKSKDENEDSEIEGPKEEKKSRFSFSRNKDKKESIKEDEPSEEEKSRFSFSRKKDKNKGKSSSVRFSFIREKTISEKHVEDILFELEMELLQGDVAMDVATAVVESVRNDLVGKKIKRSSDIEEFTFNALKNAVASIINIPSKSMTEMIEENKAKGKPLVVMFVGINGTGKTTTIGKLANYYLKKGYTPVIAASDTFRAGAIEQVTHHADNVGVKIIKHQKGSDPAAVAFDAVQHAVAKDKELVLIDTAGRMQTNTNLMDEMKKIKRVSKPDLVIFVGDALTGNDATEQAVKFNDAIDIDGVILTKADADSKGGASLSIGYVIKKPIMFLGMGQGYDDIKEYDPDWMLNQLFSED